MKDIRQTSRRKLQQCINLLQTCQEYLAEIEELYSPDYPLVSEPLAIAAMTIDSVMTLIDNISDSF